MKGEIVHALVATNLESINDPPGELESLFRAHHEQIFRTAYRITGSVVDAEDVLQTIFLRLLRREGECDFAPSPGSYFHRAAVNAALDLMRTRTRSKSVPLQDVEHELLENPSRSPEAQHIDRELHKLIQQAVARLGARTAEVFVLRYFEGFDNHEIAQTLGTSQVVIAVMLHRARGRLRKEISHFMEKHHEAR